MKAKYVLNFPKDKAAEPITYYLIKDFDLKINILNAQISANKQGYLLLDLWGEEANLINGINFLESKGIHCELFKKQLIFDKPNCVDCGSCVGVCHSSALSISGEDASVVYNSEFCTVCGLCIKACPLQLFEINFNQPNMGNS